MIKIRLLALALAVCGELSGAFGSTISENFSVNPLQDGWRIFGKTNLFEWDSTNQNLRVTWDSDQPDSYFYHSLGTIIARDDDFSLAFDLLLSEPPGPDPGPKTNTFEIAVGFVNLDQATQTNFLRGTGTDSPDLVEFDYFWDSGFGATVYPAFVDTNGTFNYNGPSDYAIFSLQPDDWYHIAMNYSASNQTVTTTITNFEATSGVRLIESINTNFADYRLGAISINSYSDAGEDPQYAGSVLVSGVIDNLVVTVPDPPLSTVAFSVSNGSWRAQFTGLTNWWYTLERTSDFQKWVVTSPTVPGNGSQLVLADTNAPAASAFYRVGASR